MKKKVFWGDVKEKRYPLLQGVQEADYVVIGGGVAGLSAANFLLEHGITNIILIERDTIGSGSTGHSAGMLVCDPETAHWDRLVRHYGAHTARLFWDAQVAALTMVKKIVTDEHIDCDMMQQELLLLAGNSDAKAHLLEDIEARRAMKTAPVLLEGNMLTEEIVTDTYSMGERVQQNISVNPLRFARGFAKYLTKKGVRIYEHTPMVSIESDRVITPHGSVAYKGLVKCLGTRDHENTQIERYLTTIAITRKLSEQELQQLELKDRDMFSDEEKRSYHYGKVTGDGRLLLGYGDTKRIGAREDRYLHMPHLNDIERFLRRAFPNIDLPIEYAWSEEYALSKKDIAAVSLHRNVVSINGAGTQFASIAATSYGVSKLLGKKHSLDALFAI